jgi:hypothetical protein
MKILVALSWLALAGIVYFVAQDLGMPTAPTPTENKLADGAIVIKDYDDGRTKYFLPRDRLIAEGVEDMEKRKQNLLGVEMTTPVLNSHGGYQIKLDAPPILNNSPDPEYFTPPQNFGDNGKAQPTFLADTEYKNYGPDSLPPRDLAKPPQFMPGSDLGMNHSAAFSHVSKIKKTKGVKGVMSFDNGYSLYAQAQ